MKHFIAIFIIVTFLSACGNNKADQRAADDDTTMVTETHYIWQSILNDSTGKLEMVPAEVVSNDSLQPKIVVDLIYITYAETDYYN